MIIRLLVWLFGLLILWQIISKFKEKKISLSWFIFWLILLIAIVAVVSHPQIADPIAQLVGVGRGVDFALFFAILVLLYLMFRFYLKISEIESQISEVVKYIALLSVGKKKINHKKAIKNKKHRR